MANRCSFSTPQHSLPREGCIHHLRQTMKKLILLLIIGVSQICFSQNKFELFINKIPSFSYPLGYNIINAKKFEVNRNICWDYLAYPITILSKNKPFNQSIGVPFDTMFIKWKGKDWNRNEPLYFEVPIMSGYLFCVGKTKITESTIGIIWNFYQRDISYGAGNHYWLCTYTKTGMMIDYIYLYYNIRDNIAIVINNKARPPEWKSERMYKFINKNTIVFKITTIRDTIHFYSDTIDYSPKYETTIKSESWTITEGGHFRNKN